MTTFKQYRANHLTEEAPPDPEIEQWIRDNKKRFQAKYGDDWEEVLYGKAWNMYNKKNN